MILNPLKKENNTEALVKALEDANAADGTADASSVGTPVADSNPAPADPATNAGSDNPLGVDNSVIAPPPIADEGNQASTDSNPAPADTLSGTEQSETPGSSDTTSASPNSSTGLSFEGNDLPDGLSSDAEAHLDTPVASGDSSELDGVKRSALEQLRPLIEKLGLEPADKFDKYLMMLRASDDPALIKPAFDAAQGITGEKQKAQALLDIINEINYITASKQQTPPTTT